MPQSSKPFRGGKVVAVCPTSSLPTWRSHRPWSPFSQIAFADSARSTGSASLPSSSRRGGYPSALCVLCPRMQLCFSGHRRSVHWCPPCLSVRLSVHLSLIPRCVAHIEYSSTQAGELLQLLAEPPGFGHFPGSTSGWHSWQAWEKNKPLELSSLLFQKYVSIHPLLFILLTLSQSRPAWSFLPG